MKPSGPSPPCRGTDDFKLAAARFWRVIWPLFKRLLSRYLLPDPHIVDPAALREAAAGGAAGGKPGGEERVRNQPAATVGNSK